MVTRQYTRVISHRITTLSPINTNADHLFVPLRQAGAFVVAAGLMWWSATLAGRRKKKQQQELRDQAPEERILDAAPCGEPKSESAKRLVRTESKAGDAAMVTIMGGVEV
jgi:hypothetical protein